jgi:glutamine phosphoribosylpyrophosphate amidotransferase
MSPGNFDKDDIIRRLAGQAAIGHVRYSTTGETRCATSSRSSPSSPRRLRDRA